MIPLRLQLSGFLSYRQQVEIDFNGFELACISGQNGAGKSSLLDAITWALFGQARRRDDAVINSLTPAAEVALDFEYEGNIYRVLRNKPRDKTTLLEFHIRDGDGSWRPLTEHSVRETEARIQHILRMDYETFTNASFFLQGKADQFAQQRPGDRKRILSNILGLEIWETYREGAAARRKTIERELAGLEGQLAEIDSELAEEPARRNRLEQLTNNLKQLAELRKAKEGALESQRKIAAALEEQRRAIERNERTLQAASQRRDQYASRLKEREIERQQHIQRLASAAEIEQAYAAWQQARTEVERWETLAAGFYTLQQRRSQAQGLIETERSRLEQEQKGLRQRQFEHEQASQRRPQLEDEYKILQAEEERLNRLFDQRASLEEDYRFLKDEISEMNADNKKMKAEMLHIRERLDNLNKVDQGLCPVCGSRLNSAELEVLISGLQEEGTVLGDRHRLNTKLTGEHEDRLAQIKSEIDALANVDRFINTNQKKMANIQAQLETIRDTELAWQQNYAPRLAEVERLIAENTFAPEPRAILAELDAELNRLGYDPAAHEAARHAEQSGRASEDQMRQLDSARAALAPLETAIADLEKSLAEENASLETLEKDYQADRERYQEASGGLPDLSLLEKEVSDLKISENQTQLQVGAAGQLVDVLEKQRERRASLKTRSGEINQQIARLKTLERAFSKDGVPALLIEQALPEIEEQANAFLERLSNGAMSVRFETQRDYKDKNRDDKKETLDIRITDSTGTTRDYEMFSGGEAFRVNFAIRLALSRVLSRRAGARLQTLVIDEGFGSQDADGRLRLIEAINLVRADFAKILVITHLEELKDAFPARVEVEKLPDGSTVRVVVP